MITGADFKMVRGLKWPATDVDCAAVVFDWLSDISFALAHCLEMRVVVQAGGAQGVWPKEFAKYFKQVFTFEPHPINFACVRQNCSELNIVAYQAALSYKSGTTGLAFESDNSNMGAIYMHGLGSIPTMCIDDLMLEACDLIQLDIEGAEPLAYLGATQTIKRHRPVLMFEDKGLSTRYGYDVGWTDFISGYRVVARPHRDVVLVPEER